MITDAELSRIDHNRMYQIYERWPEYFEKSAAFNTKLEHSPDYYQSVAFCGMGGSATSCDILNDMMQCNSDIPSTVVRGQVLPRFINKHSLVIVSSVSGNTKESISMMKEASKRNAEVICISSGGALKEEASKYGHKHMDIPNLAVPRASLPYLITPSLLLIDPLLKKSIRDDVREVPRNLDKVRNDISVSVPDESNIAKRIANFLITGFAVCFTSPYLVSAGTRFKNSLNENAKVHCLTESVLEASHNEIVPFTFNYNGFEPRVVFLKWAGDESTVNERFVKVNSFFKQIGQPFMEIDAFGNNLVSAILSSIYMLDYATIYMAVSRKMDPSATPAIDILKKM